MKKRLVYVAAPYSPPSEWSARMKSWFGWLAIRRNVTKALLHARKVAEVGAFPVVPHQLGRNIEDIGDYGFWIAGTLEVALRCDAIYAPPGWEKSKGALGEIRAADRDAMPVFYDLYELKRWCSGKTAGLVRDCQYQLHTLLQLAPQTLNLRRLSTNEVMEVRAWRTKERDLDPSLYTVRPFASGFAVYDNTSGELVFQTEQ